MQAITKKSLWFALFSATSLCLSIAIKYLTDEPSLTLMRLSGFSALICAIVSYIYIMKAISISESKNHQSNSADLG